MGEVLAHVEGRLGPCDELEAAVYPLRAGGVRLHGHVRRSRSVEDLVDHDVGVEEGVSEDGVRVVQCSEHRRLLAALEGGCADAEPVAHVGAVLGTHVEVRRVRLGGVVVVMDQRRTRSDRLHLVVDGRRTFVLNLHQRGRDACVPKCWRYHRGDGVPDELGFTSEHDLVCDLAAERGELLDVVGGDEANLVVEERGLETRHPAGSDLGPDDAQVPLTRDAAVDWIAEAGNDPRVDSADR